MSLVIGIPKALHYYTFIPLWERFFYELGLKVVESGPTNKHIVDLGVKTTVTDACAPIKIFQGHVESLARKADVVFIPRIVSFEGGYVFCPKFLGLPDMVRATVDNLPQVIDTRFDLRKGFAALVRALVRLGTELGSGRAKALVAALRAIRHFKQLGWTAYLRRESGVAHGAEHGAGFEAEHGVDRGAERRVSSEVKQGVGRGVELGVSHGAEQGVGRGVEFGVSHGAGQGVGRGVEFGVDRGAEQRVSSGVEHGVGHGVEHGVRRETEHDVQNDEKLPVTIAVIGYPYIVHDPFLSCGMIEFLEKARVRVVTMEDVSTREIEAQRDALSKQVFWHYSNRALKAAYHLMKHTHIDGLVHATAFGCGPDAIVDKFLEIDCKHEYGVPFLSLTVDEHSGQAGVVTRLEAFLDMILRKKGISASQRLGTSGRAESGLQSELDMPVVQGRQVS